MHINQSRFLLGTSDYICKNLVENKAENPKLHLLLHFFDMIVTYDAPTNYDSQCPEHNHKYAATKPSCRTQKNKHCF